MLLFAGRTVADDLLLKSSLFRYLPKDLKSKKIKTILIVRNPKDVLVSSYNHHTGFDLYKYNGRWEDWLPMYNAGKCNMCFIFI